MKDIIKFTEELKAALISSIKYSIDMSISDDMADDMLSSVVEWYEHSKWIKFDINDKTTYPESGSTVIITDENIDSAVGEFYIIGGEPVWKGRGYSQNPTHWQSLPEFKRYK